MTVRIFGLGLILVSGIAVHWLYVLVHTAAHHSQNVGELLLAALIVVTGLGGVLMAAVGNELFRRPDEPWHH